MAGRPLDDRRALRPGRVAAREPEACSFRNGRLGQRGCERAQLERPTNEALQGVC